MNDTCAARNKQTGHPRTDPDIAGHVAPYFEAIGEVAETWETWYAQRVPKLRVGDQSRRFQQLADTSALTAVASGKRKTLYGSAFYHFDRATEVYVVADKLSLTDGYRQKSTAGFLDLTEFGVGLRTRF